MSAAEEYKDPAKVRKWLKEQRSAVERYLAQQQVWITSQPDPRWDVAPYVAIWEITGGWVISGDLPTDYVLDETICSPREAMRFFADKFAEMAECMLAGRRYPGTTIGNPNDQEQQKELGGLLQSRARTLSEFADIDDLWPAELDEWQEKPE